mmetsp:Transcript_31815/g.62566  ORF Transcript_31815/g.62566 Transcript_31815/m.62566 type:complete len:417 (+) Transcript_31815:126-1376(+)
MTAMHRVDLLHVAGFKSCPFYKRATGIAKSLAEKSVIGKVQLCEFDTQDEFQTWLLSSNGRASLKSADAEEHSTSPLCWTNDNGYIGSFLALKHFAEESGVDLVLQQDITEVAPSVALQETPGYLRNGGSFTDVTDVPGATLAGGFSQSCTGEWAGWLCEFSPVTGALLPVPEHLVSQDLVDWGMVPPGFEIMVSERTAEQHERRTVTLLPETGCRAEAARADVRCTTLSLANLVGSIMAQAFTLDTRPASGLQELCTFFFTKSKNGPADRDGAKAALAYRYRVTLTVSIFDSMPILPSAKSLHVAVERKWHQDGFVLDANLSSAIINGGSGPSGLDLDLVSTAVGSPCFGEGSHTPVASPAEHGLRQTSLPAGLVLREKPGSWLEVALRSSTGEETVVRRDVAFEAPTVHLFVPA